MSKFVARKELAALEFATVDTLFCWSSSEDECTWTGPNRNIPKKATKKGRNLYGLTGCPIGILHNRQKQLKNADTLKARRLQPN